MPSKQVLNRQVQVLENALKELTKAHNEIIREINEKTHCEECKKAKIKTAKKRKREFNLLYATMLGAFTHIDYSQQPYKLFEKEEE